MRALVRRPGSPVSEMLVAAPIAEPEKAALAAMCRAMAVLRRIDDLTRLKSARSRVSAQRERNFGQIIDNARLAAEQGDAGSVVSAMLALDLLSLELCDE